MADANLVQARCCYSGKVQGVFFRATAQRLARARGIHGWVRNLLDGRVEMVAQGTRAQINDLLLDITREKGDGIEDVEIHYDTPSETFTDFEIKR